VKEQNEIKFFFVAVIFLFTLVMSSGKRHYKDRQKLAPVSQDAV